MQGATASGYRKQVQLPKGGVSGGFPEEPAGVGEAGLVLFLLHYSKISETSSSGVRGFISHDLGGLHCKAKQRPEVISGSRDERSPREAIGECLGPVQLL